MADSEVDVIPETEMTLAYDLRLFAEGFPPGTIVENVGDMALGWREGRLTGVTLRGSVIAGTETGHIHVDFDESFRGHSRIEGEHTGHCHHFLPEELRVINMPTNNPSIPTEIPRLRVSIVRGGSYNAWMVRVENGPIAHKIEVKQYMDKDAARRIGGRIWNSYDLNGIVHRGIDTYGIDPQLFIDAIIQATLAKQAREAIGTFSKGVYDSELQRMMGSQPAIIAIGDQMFTLQPRGAIKTNRAMAIIKERVVKVAREQAIKIKVAAEAEARTIIRNSERQLEVARQQIAKERAAVSNILTMPEWISENFLKVRRWDSDTYKMAVGIEVSTRVTAWHMVHLQRRYKLVGTRKVEDGYSTETIRWQNTMEHRDTIPTLAAYHSMTVWVPFDHLTGAYAYKSCRIIENDNSHQFPHIGRARCCMDLSGLPKKLTNMEEYQQLSAAINRGNQEVNLESLLHGFDYWHPDVQNQCPRGLKKLIDRGTYVSPTDLPDESFIGADRIKVEDEAKEIFNVDSLRESRAARGEELPEIVIETDGLAEVEGIEIVDRVDTEVEEG